MSCMSHFSIYPSHQFYHNECNNNNPRTPIIFITKTHCTELLMNAVFKVQQFWFKNINQQQQQQRPGKPGRNVKIQNKSRPHNQPQRRLEIVSRNLLQIFQKFIPSSEGQCCLTLFQSESELNCSLSCILAVNLTENVQFQ